MNHGYFVSPLWRGFRALALIPKEWDWGLLGAFGHQRAGNGRDGDPPSSSGMERESKSILLQAEHIPYMLPSVELHIGSLEGDFGKC